MRIRSAALLSTTSMAVVYAVMLETGFNKTEFGKGILAACFINDLGTVIALGLLFAPFTYKTIVFIAGSVMALALLPVTTAWLTRHYAHRTAAIRTKWVMLILFGLGALALWSGSEAVLPAYLAGMVLAGGAARDAHWICRLRTLTVGFLTPFYFLRAVGRSYPSRPCWQRRWSLLPCSWVRWRQHIFGLYPFISFFRQDRNERWYYTLMMSTGLTFTIIVPVRPRAWVGDARAVFVSCGGCHCKRRRAYLYCGDWPLVRLDLLPRPDQAGRAARRINGLSDEG